MSHIDDHPGWQWCTAEGAELHTLLSGLHTPFRDKLRWLEEAENLAIQMRPETSRDRARTDATARQGIASKRGLPKKRE
jgi:hypothetical protein